MSKTPSPSSDPETTESIEKDSRPVSVAAWGCLRVALLVVGLCSGVIGAVFVAVCIQGEGRWFLAIGIPLLGLGLWFIWTALFGKRSSVDQLTTDFLADLLSNLF